MTFKPPSSCKVKDGLFLSGRFSERLETFFYEKILAVNFGRMWSLKGHGPVLIKLFRSWTPGNLRPSFFFFLPTFFIYIMYLLSLGVVSVMSSNDFFEWSEIQSTQLSQCDVSTFCVARVKCIASLRFITESIHPIRYQDCWKLTCCTGHLCGHAASGWCVLLCTESCFLRKQQNGKNWKKQTNTHSREHFSNCCVPHL